MDEDTLLEEGLYDRPQSPPPPPPHPPPEGQVQAPEDPFAGLFPALRVPDRPVLPESVHEYVDKFMDREAFESQFTDFPTVFAPPRLDPNFKLGPFAKELERLTLSSTDRAGHALAPLCHLMGAVQDPDLRNAIALATLAVGQAIAQLSYVRRLNALRELWGSTHLDSARSVIKEASGSFPRDVLFGENFTDLCKKQGGTPPAPKPPVQSYNFTTRHWLEEGRIRGRRLPGTGTSIAHTIALIKVITLEAPQLHEGKAASGQLGKRGLGKMGVTFFGWAPQTGDFVGKWEELTTDREILSWVEGITLDFLQPPPFPPKEVSYPLKASHQKVRDSILTELYKTGVIRETANPRFLAGLFIRDKRDRGHRVIVDLSPLNKLLSTTHFKMEGLPQALTLLEPGDFM